MRLLPIGTFLLVFAGLVMPQNASNDKYGLPALHNIKEITLSPSYSCRSADVFARGYEGTALFLSAYAKQRNSPDLLFNGACRSADYFEASTGGDDMGLIADLGENLSLEELSAHKSFNVRNVAIPEAESRFVTNVAVKIGHTYAVLLNKSNLRGLFVFTVTDYVPNRYVTVRYAVKMYDIFPTTIRSESFSWEKGN